jgi:uncharacterized protein (TIGR03067 family)
MRQVYFGLTVLVALVVAGSVPAGSPQDGQDVLKQIQGKWQFTAEKANGQAVPAEALKNMTVTFKGDHWTVRDGDKVVQAGTHKFDTSKKPIQIDAPVTEGEGKGSTMLGICEIKGDTMKVCFDPMGKERPTSLTAKEDQFSATVKRVKNK